MRLRSFGCTRLAVCTQALAQLTEFFPSMPPSAIADALRKVGGNVEQAADLLFKARQERLRVLWVLREPPLRQPTDVVRWTVR